MLRKFAVVLLVLALSVAILPTAAFGQGASAGQPEVSQAVKHDVSLPLRDMQAAAPNLSGTVGGHRCGVELRRCGQWRLWLCAQRCAAGY